MKMTGEMYSLLRWLFLYGGLSLAAWSDLRKQRIPGRILKFLLWTGVFLAAAESWGTYDSRILSGAAAGFLTGGGLCLLCYLLSGGGFGAGDVKLLAVTGLYVGAEKIINVFVLSMLLAGGVCLGLILCRRAGWGKQIPLVPFVWAAVIWTAGI